MRKYYFLLLISFISFFANAQNADSLFIKKLSDEIMVNGKAYDNLRQLCKQIGNRLSGSPQMYKAEAWGVQTLEKSGADKVWKQQCKVPHWVRGGKDQLWTPVFVSANNPKMLDGRLENKYLDVLAIGNSEGTGNKVLTGEVVLVNSFDELENKKEQVKDKIVFFNYHFNETFVRTFAAYRDAVKYRASGASSAAKYGAKAVIVRSMSHATDNFPHTGGMRYDTAYSKIPAMAIGLGDADWLAERTTKGKIQVSMKSNAHFLPDTLAHNIIGELKGSVYPDQYITIGGHLDSWDVGEGAHDDGAGIVQTIDVMRALKALGYQPRYTIRFVLFANEENGLRGGTKYFEEAKAKNEKHLFALESDAGGFTPRGIGIDASDEVMAKIKSWAPLLKPYGCDNLEKGGGGADIGQLKNVGAVLSSLSPDSQRYFDIHHARSDVFEAVNKRELHLGAVNMAALIYLVDKYGL
ncbi:MAG TPA: M20/M25/M40 family metallo-hydrolase [Chitinophagaceae bacterium]|jgi:carboxypeptidase Q|nr:M20/M25/M40 family metallo-hydrolase [Chitinophagaceae bacterium]